MAFSRECGCQPGRPFYLGVSSRAPLRSSRTGSVAVTLRFNVRKGLVARPCHPPNFASPCETGTKPSILTSCAIPREALNHSSGFISNSASSELFADALSTASEAESTVKLLIQIRFAAKPTPTVQAGNVVSNSLQIHQLVRRCACCTCEFKCKKQIYLWISPWEVQSMNFCVKGTGKRTGKE